MSETAPQRIAALLAQRGPGTTLCPSEVARDLAGPHGEWRARMAEVHAAVDLLHAEGRLLLTWRGRPLTERAGPYRIALAP